MKTHTLHIRPGASSYGGPVTACRNLVPVTQDGREFLGIAPAAVLVAEGECRPLATRHRRDGSAETLWSRILPGRAAGLWNSNPENPSDFTLVKDDISARCAIATSTGFIVMTDSGPLTLSEQPDDGTLAIDLPAETALPFVTVETVTAGEISTSTPSMTLKDVDFSRTSPQIRDSDITTLGKKLSDAYLSLAATAADGGMWMQPVAASYHLLSGTGTRLFSSSPVIIAPEGWQCADTVSAEGTKSGSDLIIPALRLTAQAYRLSLRIDAGGAEALAAAGVAAIEVVCTPQLHIIDSSESVAWRLTRQSTDSPLLTVTVPGATDHFCSRNAIFAGRLSRMASAIDSLGRVAATIRQPFAQESVLIRRTISDGTATEIRLTSKSLESTGTNYVTSAATDSLLSQISAPNSFSAATVTVSGDTVAWADITPIPSMAVNAAHMCAEWTEIPCSGVLKVTRRDGSFRVTSFSLPRSPGAWAPAVITGDIDAVTAEIFIRTAGGAVTRGYVQLTPMPDGRHAGHIFPALRGDSFAAWSGSVPSPATTPRAIRYPGAIVTAEINAPFTPLSALECCHSPVLKLLPAIRSQSSWDFSRCHLYAFSAAAVHAVSLSPRRRLVSATVIDPRGIASPCAATRTDSYVAAIHGSRILRLKASHIQTDNGTYGFRQAAWDSERQRLWLTDAYGNLSVADENSKTVSAISAPVDIENIYSEANRIWLADSDALYRPESEAETAASNAMRDILWCSDIHLPPHSRMIGLELRMSARCFNGTISLCGARTTGDTAMSSLLHLRIDGSVDAPLIFRLTAPPRPWVRLELSADTSTDFHFDDIIIHLSHHD